MQAMLMKALASSGTGGAAAGAPSSVEMPASEPVTGAMGPAVPPGGVSLENRMMSQARQTTEENTPGMFQPGGFFGGGMIGAMNNPDPNAPGMFDRDGYFGDGLIAHAFGKPQSPERLRDRMMGRRGPDAMFGAMNTMPSSLARQRDQYGIPPR
jgi:hypothetical protein